MFKNKTLKNSTLKNKIIGDKKFYKSLVLIALPIMIQNGITNFVSLLDNIMIGQTVTEAMSGVSIVNQIMNVYNIAIFGLVSGAGIFGAQFFGSNDDEGFRQTMRFKVLSSILVSILCVVLFIFSGKALISLFIHDSGEVALVTLQYGQRYLKIMMIEMIPFALVQTYSSALRERGEAVLPMISGIIAVLVNLILNYILIFGKFGAPALGVEGAAIATVISRFVELAVVVIWTHRAKKHRNFIHGLYTNFHISKKLTGKILITGSPLMFNEILWAGGMAVIMSGYSRRGLDVVAAFNISSTLSNLFNIVFIALGNTTAIILGQMLGAGKLDKVKDTAYKLIFTSTISCAVVGAIMICFSPFYPLIYNTTDEIRHLATLFLIVASIFFPSNALMNAVYFTVRSGGKTLITFLFDSVFVWVVSIPLCFVLVVFTDLPIVFVYFFVQATELIKCTIGFILVRTGFWINQLSDTSS
ncbi:MAG: MATE family efflux transporter [Clostridiales bacterium]|mgnify:CR=1 FL=1|nr:MATE family efflux transporter [Clostridiales bacterium]